MGDDVTNEKVSDEEILNALRRTEVPQSTSDIADNLELGQKRTRQRLNSLEDQDRVRSKSYGRGRGWWLAPSEISQPISPDAGLLIQYRPLLYDVSGKLSTVSIATFGSGGFGIITALSAIVFESPLPHMTSNQLLVVSYTTMLVGIGIGTITVFLKLLIIATDRAVSKKITN
jgi:hypothetical protein